MSKTLDIDSYDVVIRVPVRTVVSFRHSKQSPAQAERYAADIRDAVVRHLAHDHGHAWEGVHVQRNAWPVCASCGAKWTEEGEDYNGGCCQSDEDDEEQRRADNGQFGVGA